MKQNSIASGISWKLIERFSVQVIRFVLQIVLARILDPEHYGSLTLMVVFTTLANVFIQKGFSASLRTIPPYSGLPWELPASPTLSSGWQRL